MAFYDDYTVDQFRSWLVVSKWLLAILGIIFACVAIVNQWLTSRVATLERRDKTTAEQRLKATETELDRTRANSAEMASQLKGYTGPRHFTEEQLASLRKSLPNGPRGKVVMTYLTGESDAQKYAEEIGQLLADTGFEVSMSKIRWLKLPVSDIYLCARDASNAPHHAVHIQLCFQAAGLRLRAHQDEKMYSDMRVEEGAVILVVSNREEKR